MVSRNKSSAALGIAVASALAIAPVALSAPPPPLTANVLPPASSFTSRGESGITRRVFTQAKIGLIPRTSASCDGRALARPPARNGAVEGLYVTRADRVAMIETVYRYPSVAVARQAVSAYGAVAGCRTLRNGWVGFNPSVSDVAAVTSTTVVGDESRFLKAREPVPQDKTSTDLHLAIVRSGPYVLLTQNFRDVPLGAASLPALQALTRNQLAVLAMGLKKTP